MEQQALQVLHRIRPSLVERRTALVNPIRGLLSEYGIVIAKGISQVRKSLPENLEDGENGLTWLGRELFAERSQQLKEWQIFKSGIGIGGSAGWRNQTT